MKFNIYGIQSHDVYPESDETVVSLYDISLEALGQKVLELFARPDVEFITITKYEEADGTTSPLQS